MTSAVTSASACRAINLFLIPSSLVSIRDFVSNESIFFNTDWHKFQDPEGEGADEFDSSAFYETPKVSAGEKQIFAPSTRRET